ncbi:MAG: penicillin-binding protein activator, partial [Candidatus Neomarinimicrobiota bacterium]|nr:penicillin-binding protein activator [Candidatus Neomarinimicrobiota bacterium]
MSSGFAQNWLQNQRTERQFKEAVSSYNDGRFAIAEEISSKIIDLNNEGFNEKTLLLLLKSQVALNKSSAAKITAKRLFTDYPASSFLPFIMESMGDLYVNSSNYESAYRMYSRAKQSNDNKDFDIKIDKKLLKLIKIKLPQALLDELLVFESNPSAVNIHLLAIAFSQIMDGLPDAAALTLGKIDPSMLSNEFSDLMESLLRESYKPSSPVLTIGLAVPLSGDDSDMGNYFLKGFEKGQNSNSFNNQRLSILAKDTKSDNIETIKVVNELKSVDQLMGIISPLDNAESISLLSSLNNSDIPVLLTNRHETEVKKINQNAFLLSSSYTVEGRIAAQYIVKHLGLDSIAVVAPANKKTEIQIDAFINEVNRLGGNVVATEWYTGEPKNLRRQFKDLRKVAFELEEKKKTFDVALGMDLDSLD